VAVPRATRRRLGLEAAGAIGDTRCSSEHRLFGRKEVNRFQKGSADSIRTGWLRTDQCGGNQAAPTSASHSVLEPFELL
jgi:hypothetical protein